MVLRIEPKSRKHFDFIASDYDSYKRRNWYYYCTIKYLIRELIPNPENTRILEVGCGTGDILHFLNPKEGVGVDTSRNMIKNAREKYETCKNLRFIVGESEDVGVDNRFDYILLVDVAEHLDNVTKVVERVKEVSDIGTRFILITPNPKWSLIMHILEKLRLKMPEGPHSWITLGELEDIVKKNDFVLVEKGHRFLMPIRISILSETINSLFYRIPLVEKLGLIQYLMVKKN